MPCGGNLPVAPFGYRWRRQSHSDSFAKIYVDAAGAGAHGPPSRHFQLSPRRPKSALGVFPSITQKSSEKTTELSSNQKFRS